MNRILLRGLLGKERDALANLRKQHRSHRKVSLNFAHRDFANQRGPLSSGRRTKTRGCPFA